MSSIASKIGCTAEMLRTWVRQAQYSQGIRGSSTSAERERLKQLEREVRALKRAKETLRKASYHFSRRNKTGRHLAPTEVKVLFIDDHRAEYGVEPICNQLRIAPSTFYERKAGDVDTERLPHPIAGTVSPATRTRCQPFTNAHLQ